MLTSNQRRKTRHLHIVSCHCPAIGWIWIKNWISYHIAKCHFPICDHSIKFLSNFVKEKNQGPTYFLMNFVLEIDYYYISMQAFWIHIYNKYILNKFIFSLTFYIVCNFRNVMTSQDAVNFVSDKLKSGMTSLSQICEEVGIHYLQWFYTFISRKYIYAMLKNIQLLQQSASVKW